MMCEPARHAKASTISIWIRYAAVMVVALAAGLYHPPRSWAQANQFGGQDRADAATRMIILAVQQGIDSLPPTSGQSFTWTFDPRLEAPVRSKYLGPTVLRTPDTIGAGRFALRLATSYFELDDSFGPTDHSVQFDGEQTVAGFGKLGTDVSAKVGLISLAASYGVTRRLELSMNLPVVIVDAHAAQVFSTMTSNLNLPPGKATWDGPPKRAQLNQALALGLLTLRRESFSDLGFKFAEGTHAGVGRISIGAKGMLYNGERAALAAASEFFFPSPNEHEFAGPESASILPRLVGAFQVADRFRLHLDAGYEYDFEHDELRRFVWNAGASVPGRTVTFDFGFGGSKFNQGIQWTLDTARGVPTDDFRGSTITAVEDHRLGSNFVDFVGGVKVRLTDSSVVAGAVSVPVNDEGLRPAALGTLALEVYL